MKFTMQDFIHPKRSGSQQIVAQRGGVKIECYWPESNDEPRFRVRPAAPAADCLTYIESREAVALLNEVLDEYINGGGKPHLTTEAGKEYNDV